MISGGRDHKGITFVVVSLLVSLLASLLLAPRSHPYCKNAAAERGRGMRRGRAPHACVQRASASSAATAIAALDNARTDLSNDSVILGHSPAEVEALWKGKASTSTASKLKSVTTQAKLKQQQVKSVELLADRVKTAKLLAKERAKGKSVASSSSSGRQLWHR